MKTSYLNDWNADLLDEYYQRWKEDPASVDSSWSAFFEGFELGSSASRNGKSGLVPGREGEITEHDRLQERVDSLVFNYRILGHTQAQIDPLAQDRLETPALTLAALGLEDVPLYFPDSNGIGRACHGTGNGLEISPIGRFPD